jgi:hypothetical protein
MGVPKLHNTQSPAVVSYNARRSYYCTFLIWLAAVFQPPHSANRHDARFLIARVDYLRIKVIRALARNPPTHSEHNAMKTVIFLILLVLGFAMFFIGAMWTKIFPVTTAWTDEKATRLIEVNERLAQLRVLMSKPLSMHSGPDRGAIQRELIDLIRERDDLLAEFQEAMERRQPKSGPLQVTGIAIAGLGVVVWLSMRFHEMRHDEFRSTAPNI